MLFQPCFIVGHWHWIKFLHLQKSDVRFSFIFGFRSALIQRWSTALKSDVEFLGWVSNVFIAHLTQMVILFFSFFSNVRRIILKFRGRTVDRWWPITHSYQTFSRKMKICTMKHKKCETSLVKYFLVGCLLRSFPRKKELHSVMWIYLLTRFFNLILL